MVENSMKKILFLFFIFFASCAVNPHTKKVNIHNRQVVKHLNKGITSLRPLVETELYRPSVGILTCIYYEGIEEGLSPKASMAAAQDSLYTFFVDTFVK